MSKLDAKIKKLEDQRLKLEKDLEALKAERNQDILRVLEIQAPGNIPTQIIIGGLLYVLETAQKNETLAEGWRQTGEKFCARLGSKKVSSKSQQAAKSVSSHE